MTEIVEQAAATQAVYEYDVTVVLPCLNEQDSIVEVIDECRAGLADAGLHGEIIVSDNGSTDRSAELAAAAGARVISSHPQGYGAAYLAGLQAARGEVIVMGDADLTYPMRRLGEFVESCRRGADMVVGNRDYHKGNMPLLNRMIGNPVLSGLARVLFDNQVRDFHCGMRAVRADALDRLALRTPGMEFASEMIVKAHRAGLSIDEIDIEYRERVGESKLSRWRDGWRHVRFLVCHAPDALLLRPGLALTLIGMIGVIALSFGNLDVFGRSWQIHTHLACAALALVGLQAVLLGSLARHFRGLLLPAPRGLLGVLHRHFTLEKGLVVGLALLTVGLVLAASVVAAWASVGFGEMSEAHMTVTALTLIVAGAQIMVTSVFAGIIDVEHAGASAWFDERPGATGDRA